MSTYKIGNKVKGIIRAYNAGKLGNTDIAYDNQPYAILKDIDVSLTFEEQTKNSIVEDKNHLIYNHDTLKEVTINNVLITDRILELLYKNNTEEQLFSKQENYESDEEGIIYFNFPSSEVYQVFIYDDEGSLENAFGTYSGISYTALKPNSTYSIYYSYLGEKSFLLDKPDNNYVKLDFEVIGNEDDGTRDMSIHIEKCILKTNKNMYFTTNNSNAIDLRATVIYTGKDYITLK